MSTTINMNLSLPTPTVTLGPAWASQLNSALTLVDEHDHSTGKGKKITPAGLNISSDLSIASNNLLQLRSVRFNNQASTLNGAQDVRSVYVSGGDLYYNNNAGVAVQITDGSTPAAAPAGASINYSRFASSGASLTIAPSVQYSFVDLDTTSNAITVTLPAANAVSAGRFFFFKDTAGNTATNAITINPSGSDEIDGESSTAIETNFDAVQLISNGTDAWSVYRIGVGDGAVTTAKLAPEVSTALVPTGAKMGYVGTTAPTGWVLGSGRTIGNASSGATERANADTEALFTLLWNSYSNAQLAVSGGRGASAAADFAANKTIATPDYRGRVGVGKDDMGGSAASRTTSATVSPNGTTMGATGGSETHTLTTGELAAHTHGAGTLATSSAGAHTHTVPINALGSGGSASLLDNTGKAGTITTASAGAHTHTITGSTASNGSGSAHNNLQDSIIETVIIKL